MAKIRQELEFDDGGLLAGLRAIREETEKTDQAFDELGNQQKKSSKQAQDAFKKQEKAVDGLNSEIKENVDVTKKSNKEAKKWTSSVKDSAREMNIFGVNVGQTADKLNKMKAGMLASSKAVGGGTKALKAFRIALASTGIGLIVVALGTMVTYFTKSQRGLDKLNIAFKAIGSVIDNVIDRISAVGEGFISIISGDFRKGFGQIKNSFAGIGEEIREDVKAATDLEKRQQELIKVQRALTVEEAKRRTEIEKLREESRKQGITDDEAIEKLEKAGRLEDELAAKRASAAREEYEILKERNQLADSKNADLDAEAEALARLEGIEGQRARKNRQLLSELQSFRNKNAAQNAAHAKARQEQLEAEQERIQGLKDAYAEFTQVVNQRVQAEKLASLEGIERIEEERRIAKEQVELLEAQAKAAALAAGEAYNLDQQFQTLYENIEKGYTKAVKELTEGRENDTVIDALLPTTGLASNAERLVKNYKTAINLAFKEDGGNELQEIKESMMDWLGLDDQDIAILSDSFATLYDVAGQAFTDNIDRQLDQNQRLIDGLREQTEVAQQELEAQLELQEQGRSNNVASKKRELEELQKAEEAALREQTRLKRSQAKAQLAADAAMQISNLVTGVTNLLKTEASKGVIGIGIAALAIPAFLALFNSAKAAATAAAAGTQRAYKGGALGNYLSGNMRRSGFVDRGGKSDIPGRGDGYRVQGTDLLIGGDEFLTNEETSRRQDRFLGLMNSGRLDNYNLYDFFKSPPPVEQFNKLTERRGRTIIRQDRQRVDTAISSRLDRLIAVTQQKTDWYPIDMHEKGRIERDGAGNVRVVRK